MKEQYSELLENGLQWQYIHNLKENLYYFELFMAFFRLLCYTYI